MKNELIKISEDKSITPEGRMILNAIQENWGKVNLVREKTKPILDDEGEVIGAKIMEETIVVDSNLKKLNRGLTISDFKEFALMVNPEDCHRVVQMIGKGIFEVEQAKRAFMAPQIVANKELRPKTWEECQALNSPTLVTLRNYKGLEKATGLVHAMLVKFARSFGRRNDLDDNFLTELAEDIILEFKNKLTIADLKMIFSDASKSTKKTFNLDYQTIMALLNEQLEAKQEYQFKRSYQEHIQQTSEEKQQRDKVDVVKYNKPMTITDQVKQAKLMAKNYKAGKNSIKK